MANSVGRPKIELSDLKPGWKESMIALASQGASIVELAVDIDVSRDTFYALSDREEEFFDTVKKCKQLSEKWWEEQGRINLDNKNFSYVGWYMNMKNRFGWKDRQDITSDDKPIVGATIAFNEKPNTDPTSNRDS